MPALTEVWTQYTNGVGSLALPELVPALDRLASAVNLHSVGFWPQLRVFGDWDAWTKSNTFLNPALPNFLENFLAGAHKHGSSVTPMLLRTEGEPFTLSSLERRGQGGEQRWFLDLYRDAGCSDVLFCPANLWAGAFYARNGTINLPPAHRALLHQSIIQASAVAQRQMEESVPVESNTFAGIKLTPKERQTLIALALGKDAKEIAYTHRTTYQSVNRHITELCRKFGVNHPAGAVYRARELGIIRALAGILFATGLV